MNFLKKSLLGLLLVLLPLVSYATTYSGTVDCASANSLQINGGTGTGTVALSITTNDTVVVTMTGNCTAPISSGNVFVQAGSGSVTLNPVMVTAQNSPVTVAPQVWYAGAVTGGTLNLTITYAAPPVSNDSSLTMLYARNPSNNALIQISPTFASGTTSYTASVDNSVSSVRVYFNTSSVFAMVRLNGTPVMGAVTINNLSVGTNTIPLVVTAQDTTTTTTYTITVTRAGLSNSTDATLSAMTISSGTLSPTFASGTTSYSASVANSVTSVTLTPTVNESHATVKVNGTTVTSGSASGAISLNVGSNTITTVVTAQDGTTTITYTTTVTRAAAPGSRASITDAVDNTVTGTVLAQATAAQRFAESQVRSVSDHIQGLRNGFNVKNNRVAVGLNMPGLDPLKQAAQEIGNAFKKQSAVKVAQNDLSQTKSDAGYIKLAQADTLPSDISVTNADEQDANLNDRLFGNKNIAIWASGTLDYGSMNRNDFRTSGVTAGIDYQFNPHVILGASLGYGFDNTDIDNLGSRVKSHQTTGTLYGIYRTDSDWFVDALVGYGDLKLKNDRYSSAATSVFSTNRDGDTVFGSIGVAKFFKVQKLDLQPYARLTQMSSTLDAYNEGSDVNALAYDKATIVSRAVSAGFTASYDIVLQNGKLTPNAKFELRHNSRGSINQTISYADTPAEAMTYSSTPAPDDIQSLGLGLSYLANNGISSDVSWFGSIGSNSYHSNALRLNVRLPF